MTELRVRWGEVDGQEVVFNANYLMYADVAVTEFMRGNGIMDHCRDEFGHTFVVDAHLIFKGSARFDDVLDLSVRCEKIGTSSYVLKVEMRRDGEVLCVADMTYVRAVEGKAAALSEGFKARLGLGDT
ncbi:acyl-CoA thioesterase [Brevundimonas aveniformis]|uniref:acyl-CoA thioesterase n=1 Tax=Brevundimonas aveniformis TaxID=370977 RepID=UPI000491F7CE|nr:thioesterase family protein [Brevundimonas aveniformis]